MTVETIVTPESTEYYFKGDLHRSNGPASIWHTQWNWYLFGEYHRYYGPQDYGNEWWIHGDYIKTHKGTNDYRNYY